MNRKRPNRGKKPSTRRQPPAKRPDNTRRRMLKGAGVWIADKVGGDLLVKITGAAALAIWSRLSEKKAPQQVRIEVGGGSITATGTLVLTRIESLRVGVIESAHVEKIEKIEKGEGQGPAMSA